MKSPSSIRHRYGAIIAITSAVFISPYKSEGRFNPMKVAISNSIKDSMKSCEQTFKIKAHDNASFTFFIAPFLHRFSARKQSFNTHKIKGTAVANSGKTPIFSKKLLLVYPSLAKFWLNGSLSLNPLLRRGFVWNRSKLTIRLRKLRNLISFSGKSIEKRGTCDTICKVKIPPQTMKVYNPTRVDMSTMIKSPQRK